MGQNTDRSAPRGARYKVYEPTNTSQLQAHRRRHPEASRAYARIWIIRFSARARVGLRSGVGVGFDAASAVVKPSFNGSSRRKSQSSSKVQLSAASQARRRQKFLESGDRLLLERLVRSRRDRDHGTQEELLRAPLSW